jgi:hypothetical protein
VTNNGTGSHRAGHAVKQPSKQSLTADDSAEVYPSMPLALQPHEAAYLDKLNDGGMIYKLFLRLCPLFRGHHHAEEILWRMGITRDDLQKVPATTTARHFTRVRSCGVRL